MATTSTTKKMTAANSKFLFEVKRLFNKPIYAKTLKLANENGIDAARAYILTHVASFKF